MNHTHDHDHDHSHDHDHGHGGPTSHLVVPDTQELVDLLRSVQTELGEGSDDAVAQLSQAAEGVAALGDALEKEKAYSAHLKQHYIDCEASESYRIGHAIVRAGKVPKRLVDSLRAGR